MNFCWVPQLGDHFSDRFDGCCVILGGMICLALSASSSTFPLGTQLLGANRGRDSFHCLPHTLLFANWNLHVSPYLQNNLEALLTSSTNNSGEEIPGKEQKT